jgi:hypothetical protein
MLRAIPFLPLIGEVTTEVPTTEVTTIAEEVTTAAAETTSAVDGLIQTVADFAGMGEKLAVGLMTATATLIVVGVVLFVKNKIQKHRRGYYR